MARTEKTKGFLGGCRTFLGYLGSGIFSPRATTEAPIEQLLNNPDREERDKLTEAWRDNKLSELNFVGVVSALLTGVLTSTGSWPTILPNGTKSPWYIRTSWYCGIIFGLASILAAADQTIRLHRLSSRQDSLIYIRHMLASDERTKDGKRQPRSMQVYTWQLPVSFLLCSALCMIVGTFALVWSATWHAHPTEWWDDNARTAVTFTTVAFVVALVFFIGQMSLYAPVQRLGEDDHM